MTPRTVAVAMAVAITGCSTPDAEHQAAHTDTTDTTATTTCTQLLTDWADRYTHALEQDEETPTTTEFGLNTPEVDIANRITSHLRWIHRLDGADPDRAGAHQVAIDDLIIDGCHDAHPTP